MHARMALTLALACACGASWLAPSAGAADAEPEALLVHDGDLLSTCDARGPGPQRLALRCGLATGESDRWGTLQTTSLRAEYGLLEQLSAGIAVAFHSESRASGAATLAKTGPGDTRLFLRWTYPSRWDLPITLGLRPALRIPTGYDREADSLAPFTSRTVDAELLGLATLATDHLDVFFNPGLSLPGEDRDTELLAGLGLRIHGGLPLGLALAGEYATRYNLPQQSYRHEVFGALGLPLPYALQAEVGLRKQLIEQESTQPELTLRLGLGLWRDPPPRAALREQPAQALWLAPVAVRVPDPRGLADATRRELEKALLSERGVELRSAASADAALVTLEIRRIAEGTARGPSIPRLLATPRATCVAEAWLTLSDAGGRLVYDERPLRVEVRRGTGIQLVPNEGDEDTWVPTGEVRERLRADLARALAREAAREIAAWMAEIPGR